MIERRDAVIELEIVVDHAVGVEAALDRGAHERPVHRGGRAHAVDRFLERADQEAVHAFADDLGHRSAWMGDHRRSAGHRFDDAEAERLVEADEVEEGPRSGEELAAAIRTDGADVRDPLSVEPGLDGSLEVLVVLNDPRDDQRQTSLLGHVDRLGGPFLGMDPSEEQEVVARPLPRLELVHVDAVVNRRDVVEALVPV